MAAWCFYCERKYKRFFVAYWFLFSFNVLTPVKRRYYKGEQREFQRRSLPGKAAYFFEEGRILSYIVPILNVAKASKD